MLKLIKISKGKTEVVLEGDRKKLNVKMKQLRSSTRNGICNRSGQKCKVEYRIVENKD